VRRATRISSLSVVLLLAVLVACDDGVSDPPGDAAPSGEGDFPVTVQHRYGTTVIPAPPERVVTAGFNDADYALAFGVVPVAVRDFIGAFVEEDRPWARDALAGAEPEKISDADGALNFEAIAAADPDLILAYSYLEEAEYQTLSSIAPTVVEPEPGSLWPEHTRDVGRALGMAARAEELVDEVEDGFAAARDAHPEFAGTTMAIQFVVDPSGYYLLEPEDPRVGLFASLGFEFPETTGEISREQVELLDQDVVVVIGAEEEDYASDELFQGLDAVREGRVVYLGGFETEFAGALGFDSPLSLPYALDIVVPQLADALDAG
jgi:iron complex transport system substrate-binding protein